MRRNADTPKVDAPNEITAAPRHRRWFLEPEMLVGFGALLVSLCALFVGAYGAYLQRSHDRASVWPHVQFGAFYTSHGVVLELTNTGIGLALIQSASVFLDGGQVGMEASNIAWREVSDCPSQGQHPPDF